MWFSLSHECVPVLLVLILFAAGEVFEKLRGTPQGWRYAKPARDNQFIRLQIALQQRNTVGFEQAVLDMSSPGHSHYGKHFQSYHEVKSMLLPSDEALNVVVSWLQSSRITDIEHDADWISFNTTVGVANRLLDTHFNWYVSDVKWAWRLRTLKYSAPRSVAKHIWMIQPTTRFGHIRPKHSTSRLKHISSEGRRLLNSGRLAAAGNDSNVDCSHINVPSCLRSLYKINYNASSCSGSKIGFSSFLEEYARYADLVKFEQALAPDALGQNFNVIKFNGGKDDQNSTGDSGEANLDLQYIVGLCSPLPVTEFSTGGLGYLVPDINEPTPEENQNEPYLAFLQNVLALDQKDLPQVISTSYGEDEQSVPETYARSVCNLYAQLGSRGVSVIFSSGDSGVGTGCLTNDGRNQTRFLPQFPATCPWVTAVGATGGIPEVATFFSAGGFSDLWPTPDYQRAAVERYLHNLGGTWKGLYNPTGRGFPDVAAQGVNYAIIDKGLASLTDGTSCASPTFAAVVALLNDARLSAGLPPMGFLNPWIYKIGYTALNDITTGSSSGCNGMSSFNNTIQHGAVVLGAGWNATEGWDPVTGWGTPDFSKLLSLAVPFQYVP